MSTNDVTWIADHLDIRAPDGTRRLRVIASESASTDRELAQQVALSLTMSTATEETSIGIQFESPGAADVVQAKLVGTESHDLALRLQALLAHGQGVPTDSLDKAPRLSALLEMSRFISARLRDVFEASQDDEAWAAMRESIRTAREMRGNRMN